MEVIDWQHRLRACQDLWLPVHYIVCPDYWLQEVQILNTNTKNRKLVDYLDSYVSMWLRDYVVFKDFIERYNLTISNWIRILCLLDSSSKVQSFKNGSYEIPDYDASEKLAEQYSMFADYYDWYNRQWFLRAFMKASRTEWYNHTEMMNKLAFQSMKLVDATTVKQYTMMLEDIYNYKRRWELVRFM